MPGIGGQTYLLGPLIALVVIGGLLVLLRWGTSRGSSLIARPPGVGPADSYGLMVAVASPPLRGEGEQQVATLAAAGVRATLVPTAEGLRVMVFPGDADRARRALGS